MELFTILRFKLVIMLYVVKIETDSGGVCIYVRDDLSFNPRDELLHDELEATWIEILLPKTKPILCGGVYRPPQQCKFYKLIEELCQMLF